MRPCSLQDIAARTGGEILAGKPSVSLERVATDTRRACAGALFVALRGERFDGHQFLQQAAARGAAAALVERASVRPPWPPLPLVAVADTRRALAALAAHERSSSPIHVVAVAGSNGKTSTKDLLAAALRSRWRIVASEASFNNELGVPLTLLELEANTQAAVVEIGTNHPGELAPLVRLAAPGIGVLTSLGREHLEHFGGFDGVVEEEGWLAELLPADGVLFAPDAGPGLDAALKRMRGRTVRVGLRADSAWQLTSVRQTVAGTTFTVRGPAPQWTGEYTLRLLGRHQALNALFALGVGAELGLSPEDLAAGLATCQANRGRLQLRNGGDWTVLDDTYNANADSMQAALATVRELAGERRVVAVLGEMAELGAHGPSLHAEVGRCAAAQRMKVVIAVGAQARPLADAARAAGCPQVLEVPDGAAATETARGVVRPGDFVLVKASRAARLETVVEALAPRKAL